jgi:protein-disulfide isomerase
MKHLPKSNRSGPTRLHARNRSCATVVETPRRDAHTPGKRRLAPDRTTKPRYPVGKLVLIGLGLLLLGAAITATVVIKSHMMSVPFRPMIENRDVLVRPHAATLGNPDAKVHIVEFLDPACAACATMHTEVKRLLALYPDKVRLTARHVAFHDGSDYAIKVLAAAKKQGKYWQTLEALYATRSSWVVDNVVQPAALWRAVDHVGLNAEQLKSDFERPEVAQQFDQDMRDARLLRVAETPKFFVNARPVPGSGANPLHMLIKERLRSEYISPARMLPFAASPP